MNRRILIFLTALALVIAIAWWFTGDKKSIPQEQATRELASSGNPVPLTEPPPATRAVVASSNQALSSTATENKYREGLISKEQAIQEVLTQQNNRPLDVYGKVVDQYGQPVAGAKVEGSVLLNVSFVSSGGKSYYTETDQRGQFSFLGVHGVKLGIRPAKDGYYYDPKLPSSRPEDYQSDPQKPLVFTMWKLKGAEPMRHLSFDARIPYDGTPVDLDLQTGKRTADGDGSLRISLLRSPLQIALGLLHPYNWTVRIEILNGGILEEGDPYPFWAPENGYQPLFEMNMSSNNVPWQSELRHNFYIKNSQGQFGRLFIDLSTTSKRPDTGITVETWLNPSGSQDLEFDPSKYVR